MSKNQDDKNIDLGTDNILADLNKEENKNNENDKKSEKNNEQQEQLTAIQQQYNKDKNMTPQEKEKIFEERLFSQEKVDAYLMYFIDNKQLQEITVPIISKYDPKAQQKIKPFRNHKCFRPGCVYSYQDLLNIYKKQGMSMFTHFVCYSCKKHLEIWNFYYDVTLQKLVDEVWKKYNSAEKIPCEAVKIFRNGEWQPILPQYIQQLNTEMRKNLQINEEPIKLKGARNMEKVNDDGQQIMANMALYVDFNNQEYIELSNKYQDDSNKVRNKLEPVVDIFDMQINYKQIDHLIQDLSFSQELIILYITYITYVYQAEYKTEIQAIIIKDVKYDEFSKNASYETLWDRFVHGKEIKANIILMHYDQRWILGIFNNQLMKCRVIDFLNQELSYIRNEDIIKILQIVIKKELKYKLQSHAFNVQEKCKKIPQYVDCGIQQCAYIDKYLSNINKNILWEIDLNFLEKENFKKKFIWLILKIVNNDLTVNSEIVQKRENLQNQNQNISQNNIVQNKTSSKLSDAWSFNDKEDKQQQQKPQKNNNDQSFRKSQSQLSVYTLLSFKSQKQENSINNQQQQSQQQGQQYQSQQQQSSQQQLFNQNPNNITSNDINYDQLFSNLNAKKNDKNINNDVSQYNQTINTFKSNNRNNINQSINQSVNQSINQSKASSSQIEMNQEELVDTLEKYKRDFKEKALQKLQNNNPQLYEINQELDDLKQLNEIQENKKIKKEIKNLIDQNDQNSILNDMAQLNPQQADEVLQNHYLQKQLKQYNISNYKIAPPIVLQDNPYNIQLKNNNAYADNGNIYEQQMQQLGYNQYFGNNQMYNRPIFKESQLFKPQQQQRLIQKHKMQEQDLRKIAKINYEATKDWKF